MSLQRNYCSKCAKAYFYEPSVQPGMHDNSLCFTCLAADRGSGAEEIQRLEWELEASDEKLGDSEEEVFDLTTTLKTRDVELGEYAKTVIRRDNTIENQEREISALKSELVELEEATKLLTEVVEGQTDGK